MPLISDIKSSVLIPALIKDDFIKNGQFVTLPNGEPMMYSGGFTSVFPVIVNGEKWAFRCWHAELGNMKRRMELLAKELKRHPLPYFCDFAYEDEGLVVNGKIYPTTRMKWIEGENIKDYICSHSSKHDLEKLASNFLSMCRALHAVHYAHGDLQHGNIMVDTSGNLFLIDYDSMYTHVMQDCSDVISGLKDYQHPKRKDNSRASEKLDYFSELIIYISILAIAENPTLIQKYKVEDADRLLFSASDFENLKQSEIYRDLQNLTTLSPLLLSILEEYLEKESIDLLEPFDKLFERYTRVPVIHFFEAEQGDVVYKNEEITLKWEVKDCMTLLLNGQPLPANTFSHTEHLSANKTYQLEAINGLHKVSASLHVEVAEKPAIKLHATSKKLKKEHNEQCVLSWNVQNAFVVYLNENGKSEEIPFKGQKRISPEMTSVYTLQVTGLDKKTVFTKEIKIFVLSESNISFSVDKSFCLPRVPLTLQWDVQHAHFVELIGVGKVPASGKHVTEIERDTIFELKVEDAFGEKKKTLEVRILPLPVIQSILVPTPNIVRNITIHTTLTNMRAQVSFPQQITSPIDALRLALPAFEGIKVEMKQEPTFIPTPKFPMLHLDVKRKSWWTGLTNKFRELNNYIENKIN